MRMKTIFLTILTLAACKTAAPDSRLASVVAPDSASGKFIVYFKETGGAGTVYRKSCQQSQVKSPGQCPTEPSSASRSWYDYERALLATGLTPTTVNGIKEALESQTAWDVQGQTSVVQKMDQAFGIDVSKAANPFTVAFVGAPVNGAAAIPVATTTSMPLAKDLVLKEMRDAADYHTAGNATYRGKPHPFPQDAVVSGSVRQACLDNGRSVSYWSEIVFHYYCQFGNLRACFTGQARTNSKDYDGYKKSFDYCIANDPTFQRYFSRAILRSTMTPEGWCFSM